MSKADSTTTSWNETDQPENSDDTLDDPQSRTFKTQRMRDAHFWAAQLISRLKNGPYAGIRGTYYVDIMAGTPTLVMRDDDWDLSKVKAVRDDLRDYGFPQPLKIRDTRDDLRLFISEPSTNSGMTDIYPGDWREFEASGGHGGDKDSKFAQDQLEWDRPASSDA